MAIQQLQNLSPSNRTKEYLAGGNQRPLHPLLKEAIEVLGRYQDDLNREFGDQAYDQMMRDPAVSACVDILKSLILSEPLRVVPRISDKKDPGYEQARKMAEFVQAQFDGMDRGISAVLSEALDAIPYGSSLVEIVYEPDLYEGQVIYRLKDLKTRHRNNYGLVVDRHYNVLGAVSKENGFDTSGLYTGATAPDPDKVIPRQKFMLVVLKGRNNDPRGVSLIRPAWNPYYLKTQVWPAYLKYLVQFSSPSLVGFTPEGAEDVQKLDENGEPVVNEDGTLATVSAELDMLETLLGFQAGTVAVLKGGSSIEFVQSEGQGEAFNQAVMTFDRQIAMAILKTHRTLLESEHSSKADSESAADITDIFVSELRETLGDAITRDVVKQLVAVNFGPETAKDFAPTATLKTLPQQDFSKAADAVGKLWTSGYIHSSQVAETDALVGLPERDMDAWLEEQAEAKEQEQFEAAERVKLLNPGAGTTAPKQEPTNE